MDADDLLWMWLMFSKPLRGRQEMLFWFSKPLRGGREWLFWSSKPLCERRAAAGVEPVLHFGQDLVGAIVGRKHLHGQVGRTGTRARPVATTFDQTSAAQRVVVTMTASRRMRFGFISNPRSGGQVQL